MNVQRKLALAGAAAIACAGVSAAVPAAPALASQPASQGLQLCASSNLLLLLLDLSVILGPGECPSLVEQIPSVRPWVRPAVSSGTSCTARPASASSGRPCPGNSRHPRHRAPEPSRNPARAPRRAPALQPGPLPSPGSTGYSPTVPFDRVLRIPLQTPRMTLRQTVVIVGIAVIGSALAGFGTGFGTASGSGTTREDNVPES